MTRAKLTVAEAKLEQAYRIRAAYHHIPERERWHEFVKWMDEEVSDCEHEAGITGIARVIRARQRIEEDAPDSYTETDKPMSGR